MRKKFLSLVERDSVAELSAYFAALPAGKPLDRQEEMVLLEYYPEAAVTSYINRFRLSEDAEIVFIDKAPGKHRRAYINFYGLRPTTQKFIIDKHLDNAALDFAHMRHFDDVDYLIEHGSPTVIRVYIQDNALANDKQVLKLLHHDNAGLFKAYVDNGRYISDDVQKAIVTENNLNAFNALVFYYHRRFKKKARNLTWDQMVEKEVHDVALSEQMQQLVFDSGSRMFIESMLRTTPLAPAIQKLMFDRNFDAEFFKLHVEVLYGVAGYRFEPELEEKLFKLLASKDFDDCLAKFRLRDDLSFVRCASANAVAKYIKDVWLSDEAQVALFARGNVDLAKKLISRYSSEHGLCMQAEIKLVEIYSPEVIKLYVDFHTMCSEALAKLGIKSPETLAFYYTKHAY